MIDFPLWLNFFEALIERNTVAGSKRLFFLSKYTAGEAKEPIKGYFMQTSEYAYQDVKNHLKSICGDKYRAANTFKKRLHNWH